MPTVSTAAVAAIAGAFEGAPFEVLGPHAVTVDGAAAIAVRAYAPGAKAMAVRRGGALHPMERAHADGFFEAVFPGEAAPFAYQLSLTGGDGTTTVVEDPYRFAPVLTDFDLHLFAEGNHYRLYEKLGAHPITQEGVSGVNFAVWAPNADRASVVGDFNGWDGRRHPMRRRGATGLWELFIPGVAHGVVYKYEVKTRYRGYVALKADPYGFASELRPNNASVVWDLSSYVWSDAGWMGARKERQGLAAPVSIYEVHLGSWRRAGADGRNERRWLTYRELAAELIPYVKEMGYTHVELLPISEHPLDASWGYQTVGYFAATARYGTPDDLRHFIDVAHQAGIGVILDWVPAHFPKDAHGLAFFDGTHLYEHEDPRLGEHQDWGTLIFNFDRNEVGAFLLSNALFWLDYYHIDGLRVDAVASMLYLDYSRKQGEWIPNAFGGRENLGAVRFLKRFNDLVHQDFPDVLTFAEESTAWPMVARPTYLGGLGFDLKWNMGWMHDILDYIGKDPVFRRYHHQKLTFSMIYAFTENFTLPFSHDEVVHGKQSMLAKMPGDTWQRFANLRAVHAYMIAHPGKKLSFMGTELGQWREWSEERGLDWGLLELAPHRRLQRFIKALNALYTAEPALYEVDFTWDGFAWIDLHDVDNSVISFLRRAKDRKDFVLVVANFTPRVRHGYRVGVPSAGTYRELLNSDAARFGGSGVTNPHEMESVPTPWQGQPFSLQMTLPPLGVAFFKCVVSTDERSAPTIPPPADADAASG